MKNFEFRCCSNFIGYAGVFLSVCSIFVLPALFDSLHSTLLVVLSLVVMITTMMISLIIANNRKGSATLHTSHVEIHFLENKREVEYRQIKEISHHFSNQLNNYWHIKVDGQDDIRITESWHHKDKRLGQFMEALQKRVR